MYDDDSLLADARRNTDEVDVVPVRNVRQRYVCSYGLVPKDSTTYLHPRLVAVDLEHLKEDDPELKKAILYLQLIRIVLGSSIGGDKSTPYSSFFKNKKKYLSLSSSFIRIFLCSYVSSVEGRVCYIIAGSNQNSKMWSRFLELRDNGSLTIGSFIAI